MFTDKHAAVESDKGKIYKFASLNNKSAQKYDK